MPDDAAPVYHAYGLRFRSEIPLPGLPHSPGPADVTIRLGPVRSQTTQPVQPGCFEIDAERLFFYYPGAGLLLARQGRELIVEPDAAADAGLLRQAVMGQGAGSILHQRGTLTLHASAVAIAGGAVAFVGERGQGKSTTAAALLRRGHPFITDDILAVEHRAEGTLAHPSVPLLKLRPDAAVATVGPVLAETLPITGLQKRLWEAPGEVAGEPLPLRAVYELEFGASFHIEALHGRRALVAVATHTYVGALVLQSGAAPQYLAESAALVRSVPVFRCTRPRDPDRAAACARDLAAHALSITTC